MWDCVVGLALTLLLQDAAASPAASAAATPLPSSQEGGLGSLLWLIIGIGIGLVIGLLLSKAFGKSQGATAEHAPSELSIYTQPRAAVASGTISPKAKRCPKCNSTYTDDALIYCVSDGATLLSGADPRAYDPKSTLVYPNSPK